MLNALLWAVSAAIVVVTLLPLTNSVEWWVRMWDFPRVHIGIAAALVVVGSAYFVPSFKLVLIALMLTVCGFQAWKIYPYTSFAKTEIDLVNAPVSAEKISFLSVNVLMENTRYDDLIHIIEREDPDVLFLMETDAAWNNAVTDTLAGYKTVKSHIADDHYGLIFATRLEAVSVEILWPAEGDTPAIKAVLQTSNNTEFNFIGLHPRPPVPGNDTEARDKQIKNAALMTASSDRPTICMGDFNDVAWSWTTQRFKQYGSFVEPRVGRGLIASFHAKYPLMRFPIDQIFLTKDMKLESFDRLENFGSDHFPMIATIYFDRK